MIQAPATAKPAPEAIAEDDGLGEREVFKDLKLAAHIDSMMHEHGKFLVEHGMLTGLDIPPGQEFP